MPDQVRHEGLKDFVDGLHLNSPLTSASSFILLSLAFQFQYSLEGTECDLDLGFRGFMCSQFLKPKSRFDQKLNASTPTLPIDKSDDFIGDPRNEGDENHPRGNFISKRKVMGDKGKSDDAHDHNDEQEARTASGMKKREAFHPIDP